MLPATSLFIGIDTGGTFTDGVLLDSSNRTVVQSVKVLTTHRDLTICIENVLEKLTQGLTDPIILVSLSTTLATNAIVEGKRKPVALFLLGYDQELVYKYNFQSQFGTPDYFFINGKHGLDGKELIPLNKNEVVAAVNSIKEKVEAYAISSYAGFRNSSHEEQAGNIISTLTDAPTVLANHLSNEFDSIRRATTASLNASLLSNTQEFINAVMVKLNKLNIACPVMILRGDGSIVKAEYARRRPVEIIHSGPATSAIGGQFLSDTETALVIDIGGTTTDIALVEGRNVAVEKNAAVVGTFRTCVSTIKVRSFGMGGDSLIRIDGLKNLSVGPERVIPFCRMSLTYPSIKQDIQEYLASKKGITNNYRLEFWALCREPRHLFKDDRTNKLLKILESGPGFLPDLLKKVGAVSPVQVDEYELLNEGIIERAGLTPTDLFHAVGEIALWDSEISTYVLETFANNMEMQKDQLIFWVRSFITRSIVAEIIEYLSGKSLSKSSLIHENNGFDRWLFDEHFDHTHPYLGGEFFLKVPIVGIGAPAKSFLPPVADTLGTRLIIPDHFEVANAVGTVVGNIIIHQDGDVIPIIEGINVKGYYARGPNMQQEFSDYEKALDFSKEYLIKLVTTEANQAGAVSPYVKVESQEILGGMITRLSAMAVGRPV